MLHPRYTGVGTAGDNLATVTGQVAAKEKWKFFIQDTHNDTAIADQWRMGRGKLNAFN